ncbi:uncharacterized protein LOC122267684 [Penaeus japonicus]|uniref:uncharacterized protein LOC122267684 n=1 Tax=Penaeus japonicus TaxID=27405 RepID=UPI001C715C72|nr:uncharacterized protein LOC122267684 [Penaeus japonicus]
MKLLTALVAAALLLAVSQAREHHLRAFCADAGPECLPKAFECAKQLKPSDEIRQQMKEAYRRCTEDSDESSDDSSHDTSDYDSETRYDVAMCVFNATDIMTDGLLNRDSLKAYVSSLTLSDEVQAALTSAVETCPEPSESDVHAFDKCLFAACIEAV